MQPAAPDWPIRRVAEIRRLRVYLDSATERRDDGQRFEVQSLEQPDALTPDAYNLRLGRTRYARFPKRRRNASHSAEKECFVLSWRSHQTHVPIGLLHSANLVPTAALHLTGGTKWIHTFMTNSRQGDRNFGAQTAPEGPRVYCWLCLVIMSIARGGRQRKRHDAMMP
ncbi:hypothetical protein SCAR479_09061 [Seiridium cardinale]|uniref:Uncharacterized protein n=1 Tax=Seiridium cardinale TaxID=138064 RepID=A0ABR2XKD9_9PEZI